MLITRAERRKAKLRLALSGISSSGKTWSALEIAHGMGGKIGMIDTEHGRGQLYADLPSKHEHGIIFQYDVLQLDAPYSPDRYIEAIKSFEKLGYDILIIDSLSHAWSGDGGVLSIVEKAGGQFQTGWKVGTPKQNALTDAIIQSKMHIIVGMRAKAQYVVELNEKGKNAPRKIGLAPIQREQIEYEFTAFMEMDSNNIAHVTKDNSNIYHKQFIQPSPEMGRRLMNWLNQGIDQKEYFSQRILPNCLEEIAKCNDLDELRDKYGTFYKKYFQEYSDQFYIIEEAKNNRKEEIMNTALDKMPVPPPNPTKYSANLSDMAKGAA